MCSTVLIKFHLEKVPNKGRNDIMHYINLTPQTDKFNVRVGQAKKLKYRDGTCSLDIKMAGSIIYVSLKPYSIQSTLFEKRASSLLINSKRLENSEDLSCLLLHYP